MGGDFFNGITFMIPEAPKLIQAHLTFTQAHVSTAPFRSAPNFCAPSKQTPTNFNQPIAPQQNTPIRRGPVPEPAAGSSAAGLRRRRVRRSVSRGRQVSGAFALFLVQGPLVPLSFRERCLEADLEDRLAQVKRPVCLGAERNKAVKEGVRPTGAGSFPVLQMFQMFVVRFFTDSADSCRCSRVGGRSSGRHGKRSPGFRPTSSTGRSRS